MSRPKPNVLLKYVDTKTYKADEILEAKAIYAVFLREKPINLRSMHDSISYPGPKYKKVSFSNPGHAHNLAEKLNKKFNTDEFEVFKLVDGTKITEE